MAAKNKKPNWKKIGELIEELQNDSILVSLQSLGDDRYQVEVTGEIDVDPVECSGADLLMNLQGFQGLGKQVNRWTNVYRQLEGSPYIKALASTSMRLIRETGYVDAFENECLFAFGYLEDGGKLSTRIEVQIRKEIS